MSIGKPQATGSFNKSLLIRSYQLHHKQMHKCHKGETQFLTYLQELFPSVYCAYKNTQTKFGVNTFIYKRDWSYFTLISGCFLSAIFRQTKIVLCNFFLQNLLHLFKNYFLLKKIISRKCKEIEKKHDLIQFWFV